MGRRRGVCWAFLARAIICGSACKCSYATADFLHCACCSALTPRNFLSDTSPCRDAGGKLVRGIHTGIQGAPRNMHADGSTALPLCLPGRARCCVSLRAHSSHANGGLDLLHLEVTLARIGSLASKNVGPVRAGIGSTADAVKRNVLQNVGDGFSTGRRGAMVRIKPHRI